ncbi:winged helix-turn-helix transcriptional regulator [Lentzea sp. CA-135723]|uniref:winged helix-turn-helix transcriptional regulator n=1 Tax=Lentzea sp. CA-135723 TaxID=3239950 RepID=UPI003D902D30
MTCTYEFRPAQPTKKSSPNVLTTLSSRWGVPVVEAVAAGNVRFNQLHRHLGAINHKVLIETLSRLQRDGYLKGPLTERAEGSVVTYRLTDLGWRLHELVAEIRDWSDRYDEQVDRARSEFERLSVLR